MTWEPELDELRIRVELAKKMGGVERVARQHDNGRLTVRERVGKLLDPGSFHEYGALAGRAEYSESGELADFTPSNFVMGTGRIAHCRVVVGGDDFTVRGGAADGKVGDRMGFSKRMALGLRLPIVRGSLHSWPGLERVISGLNDFELSAKIRCFAQVIDLWRK